MSIYINIYNYICCKFKRKTEAKVIFLNPFTASHHANGSFSSVHLFMKKLT